MTVTFSPVIDLVLGVALAVVTGIMFNLGAIYMKKGVLALKEITITDFRTILALFKSRTWLFGFFLGVGGNLPYLLAQSLAGVTLVSPLTNTGLIALALFAWRFFGERLRAVEKAAIALLVIAPFCLSFAGVTKVTYTSITANVWIAFSVFSGIAAIVAVVLMAVNTRRRSQEGKADILAINSGISFGISSLGSQLVTITLIPLLVHGTLAGIDWLVFIPAALLWAGPNLLAGLWQQQSLQKGKAARVIPLQNTGSLTVPVIGGILIFGQVVGNWAIFLPGIILIGLAIVFLARLQEQVEHSLASGPTVNQPKE
jgi:drug/metabolite transporter (DMT)-like permease